MFRFAKIGAPALMMALLCVLAACGHSAGSSTAQPSAEPAFITYKAANGEVKVPKDPKRVVVIADSYTGDFMALGIQPIGTTQGALENPYFKGKTDGMENIGEGTSIEKILELKPDLIIAFTGTENLDQLEKIAPTVAIEYGKLNYKDQLREFGKMTGREAQAEAWISGWEKKIAALKPKVEAAVGDKTVSILQPYAKGIYAFGDKYARGGEIIYGEFHLKAPKAVQKETIDSGTGWANVSLETLPDFAGDYIFTSAWSGDDADPGAVYDTKVWKALPAVKNNKVFAIDRKGSLYNDPISLEAQLDDIVAKLTEK
ncbi:iron-hydroxamate ABC transporter substrate-binding protein [Brevibacillus fluminis]|uniref:iron-hydroxamate ABC transporter substrate-binding protein n=1 Tax=Brevibacillus fluminis TaxID=511487 RepID=UPI003F898203